MDFFQGHKLYYHIDRLNDWNNGLIVPPIYAEISPTSVCNHRCLMCGYEHLGHKQIKIEPAKLILLMNELYESGLKSIVFAGDGEPLINKATVPAIVKAVNLGMDCALSTNGSLLNNELCDTLAQNLTWIRFSLNGGDEESYSSVHNVAIGSLAKVLGNVGDMVKAKRMLNSDITIGVQFVLLPENKGSVLELANAVKIVGADYFVVKPFYPVERISYKPDQIPSNEIYPIKSEIEKLSDSKFKTMVRVNELDANNGNRVYSKCYGLDFIAIITSTGDVYSCLPHIGDDKHGYGNIYEQAFSDIWNGKRKKDVVSYIDSINKGNCQPNCRPHRINEFLWDLKNPHKHKNFI